MGYLGSSAKQAADYRASGWQSTAGGYMKALSEQYGGKAVVQGWKSGVGMADAAIMNGLQQFPVLTGAMNGVGGWATTHHIAENSNRSGPNVIPAAQIR
jgi:hypothetical protein